MFGVPLPLAGAKASTRCLSLYAIVSTNSFTVELDHCDYSEYITGLNTVLTFEEDNSVVSVQYPDYFYNIINITTLVHSNKNTTLLFAIWLL